MTAELSRYELAYPELFAPLTPQRRATVSAALDDDRLEGGNIGRADVELLVRSVTENMTDAEYLAATLELVMGDTKPVS